MATLCKYEKKRQYVSYDSGVTWQALDNYMTGDLIEYNSPDCGGGGGSDTYRWVENGTICDGKDLYTRYIYQVSHDNGLHWYNVYPTQYKKGELIEANSEICDNAFEGHYFIGPIDPLYIIKCSSLNNGTLENGHYYGSLIHSDGRYYITAATISDCVTSIGDSAFTGENRIDYFSFNGTPNITSIGDYAFSGCTTLNIAPLYNGLTSIGDSAFNYCRSLTSIDIPDSVTSIGNSTFTYCSGLVNITVGSNNIVYDSRNNCNAIIETESNALIYGCNTTVIPNNVITIGDYAFEYCSGLTSVNIPDSVTSIGTSAFTYCSGLTSCTIGSGVTSIGTSALALCTSLTSIDIPNSVTRIGDYAFRECSSLSSCTIGSGVTSISDYAFFYCNSLSSIDIPNSVSSIGERAFQYCDSLTSCTIGSGVTSIGDIAFGQCVSLTSIDIPSGVTSIGTYAFSGCTSLSSITVNAITPPSLGSRALIYTNNCPIYVPCESLRDYQTANGWSNYTDRLVGIGVCSWKCKITNNDSTYEEIACRNQNDILNVNEVKQYKTTAVSVEVSNCATSIESGVFSGFTKMSACTIPNTITTIPLDAFNKCSGLTSFIIPNSVMTIEGSYNGHGAFYYCSGLTSIDIPNSVTGIGGYAFYECSSLSSCTIGSGVTSIGNAAFSYCRSLTGITVNATTPPTLGSGAFGNTNNCPIYVPCESLIAYRSASGWSDYANRIIGIPPCDNNLLLYVTNSSGSIDTYTCSSGSQVTKEITSGMTIPKSAMTSVIIGDCAESIGISGFSYCISLSSCTIGSGVTSIGYSVFRDCRSLTSITIPDSVTSIGSHAFYGCSGLTSIDIPSGVTSISNYTFYGCTSLSSCTIGSGVTSIGEYTFRGCSGLTSIDIPSGVTSIGGYAFYYCSGLTSVTINAITPPILGSNIFRYASNCPIYVPSESVSTYKSASGWSVYADRIQAIPS